jgi:hypothetical protein
VHDLYTKFTDHRRVEKVKCLKLMDINLPVGNQEKFEDTKEVIKSHKSKKD